MRVAISLLAVLVSGCSHNKADPVTGLYAKPIGGAPATINPTQYSAALYCLRDTAARAGVKPPRVAVGAISDLTGKRDFDTGAKVSQGSALFAMAALERAGIRLVERADRSVSDIELAYAKTHQLSDNPQAAGENADNYRRIFAGQIAGSDYYIVGGVTELNYNIYSSGLDARVGKTSVDGAKGSLSAGNYIINLAIDLRMINSKSQEVVKVTSYQKQTIGKEIKPGIFDFLNGNVFDISVGKSELEPIQLAVRTLVERSIYDFASSLYNLDAPQCLPASDRLKAPAPPPPFDPRATRVAAADPRPLAAAPRPATPPASPPPPAPYNGPYLDRSHWRPLDQ
jgi:curli biogenesis system outer membrane secretion channel CsgG